MKLFKLTLAIALGAIFINAKTGYAAWTNEFRSNVDPMDWSTAADWQRRDDSSGWLEANVEPIAGAIVTVRDNHTVAVTTTTSAISSLTIENFNDAVLSMRSAGVLQIDDTLTIAANGVFEFNDQTEGTPPILRATLTLEISGNIVTTSGADEGGVIAGATQAVDTVRLMATYSISSEFGPVAIEADFENDGTVTANGGTDGFDVTFSGRILDGSIGTFEVTAANSEMIFNHDVATSVPSLSGDADFNVEDGLMHFQQSLTTAGGYRQIGGKIQANAAKTFTANGAY